VLYLNTEIIYMKKFCAVNLPPEVMCDITTVYVWVLKNSFFRLYQLQEVKINYLTWRHNQQFICILL